MAEKQQQGSPASKAEMPFGGFLNKVSNLSDAQKNRLLCGLFFHENAKIDWKSAAHAYGSTSTASMNVHHKECMKKLKEADPSVAVAGASPKPKKAPATKAAPSPATKKGANPDDEHASPAKDTPDTCKNGSTAVKKEETSDVEEDKTPPKKGAGRGKKRKFTAVNDNENDNTNGNDDVVKETPPKKKPAKKNGAQKSPKGKGRVAEAANDKADRVEETESNGDVAVNGEDGDESESPDSNVKVEGWLQENEE